MIEPDGLYKPTIVKKEVDNTHYYFVDNIFVPAVTAILSETLPMPIALKTWLGDLGNEKAQYKMEKAAERGTLIHKACERLLNGEAVSLEEEFPDRSDKKVLVGFIKWFVDFQPKPLKYKDGKEEKTVPPEFIVASKLGYAGTSDLPCLIHGIPYIVDFKTSKTVMHEAYILQLQAYKHAILEMTGLDCKTAILHLTSYGKTGYMFYDDDKMLIKKKKADINDFLAVLNLYRVLNGGMIPEPPLIDSYPPIIKLERSIYERQTQGN